MKEKEVCVCIYVSIPKVLSKNCLFYRIFAINIIIIIIKEKERRT